MSGCTRGPERIVSPDPFEPQGVLEVVVLISSAHGEARPVTVGFPGWSRPRSGVSIALMAEFDLCEVSAARVTSLNNGRPAALTGYLLSVYVHSMFSS